MIMEVSTSSSSSPLSIHSPFSRPCRRRLPLRSSRFINSLPSSTISTPSPASLTSSSSPSCFWGAAVARPQRSGFKSQVVRSRPSPRLAPIRAAFERFTERAIKAIIFSQREARALGKDMVFTQHLLLGLVAEAQSQSSSNTNGFLDSGITLENAREAVSSIWHNQKEKKGDDVAGEMAGTTTISYSSATRIPFSISTKRVFEAAVEYSRTMGHNFIAPEHIAIGLFTVDDGSAARVLKRFFLILLLHPWPRLLRSVVGRDQFISKLINLLDTQCVVGLCLSCSKYWANVIVLLAFLIPIHMLL